MNLHKLDHNELLARCAWCHRRIPENQERFGTGGRLKPEGKVLTAGKEGTLIPMPLKIGRAVIVVIPGADSEAHKAGHDVYFQACSEECLKLLSQAVRDEMEEST